MILSSPFWTTIISLIDLAINFMTVCKRFIDNKMNISLCALKKAYG
jgi:hypothetical protein